MNFHSNFMETNLVVNVNLLFGMELLDEKTILYFYLHMLYYY